MDLEDAIKRIRMNKTWNDDIFDRSSGQADSAKAKAEVNASIAIKWILKTLLARWYIFRLFIEVASESGRKPLTRTDKRAWVLFQALPHLPQLKPLRPFQDFMGSCLGGMEVEDLLKELSAFSPSGVLGEAFSGKDIFFLVLDEAQFAGETYPNAFLSTDGKTRRPVLRQILEAWNLAGNNDSIRFIFSGTGFSLSLFQEVARSSVAKEAKWQTVHHVGGFDTPEGQRVYIERYFPGSFLEEASGKELVSRMYRWLRGR